MKKIILSTLLVFALGACAKGAPREKPLVVASFYPLAHFAEQIVGDKMEVVSVIEAGSEPHAFEPSPSDVAKISQADLLVYNGAGLDFWAEKLSKKLDHKLKMADQVDLIGENAKDPHIWLSIKNAEIEVEKIAQKVMEIDPENKAFYQENLENYMQKLQNLDQKYQDELRDCELDLIITSHEAFAYLARDYGFEQIGVKGVFAENEPSIKDLEKISNLIKDREIKYIFAEELVSPKISETLAQDYNLEVLVLNPLPNFERGYLETMEENLVNLKKGVLCQ